MLGSASKSILLLRIIHGLFSVYFIVCVFYLYYAAIVDRIDGLFWLALGSLAVEGFVVFILNKGDCPLIHIQRKIGDDVPFFETFLPQRMAKKVIPFFTFLTWFVLGYLLLKYLFKV